ncbi:MAG: aminopeptidase P family protein [Methylocystis sp.]
MFEAKFQNFVDEAGSLDCAERLSSLRGWLKTHKLDGFLIPRADAHQNEYVPKCAERLAWLTGFTGSAGFAIILPKQAAIFVDGRYVIQVRQEIDARLFAPLDIADVSPANWLARHVRSGARIAYDPWLHTSAQIERFKKLLAEKGATLIALDQNPIDALWRDRPAEPKGRIFIYPSQLAGQSVEKKLARLRVDLGDHDGALLSDPHAIAWLFNFRGADVAHTPIALCFALVPKKGLPRLYIDPEKVDPKIKLKLQKFLSLHPPKELLQELRRWGKKRAQIMFDAATSPDLLVETLRSAGGLAHVALDPIALPKAVKNSAEINGARQAHIRDGLALSQFLAWFAQTAPKGKLTEISAAQALETFRRENGELRDISFPTISAFAQHAAIPHYRVTTATNLPIKKGVYLVDSGAQYLDGTTDVTRTVIVGAASKQFKDHYTRVLKGHIAIARAVFPKGVSGAQIDAFARQFLWQAGLDFDHGTGHGVGAYLSVHEGPQRISKVSATPLQPGMILSNEPGYYRAGEYGIRLENLVIVEKREIKDGERETYGFETITLAPFDHNCIARELLTPDELHWLNAYHARVYATLSPLADAKTRAWLKQATRKLM